MNDATINIIKELETELGIELHVNDIPDDILCDGATCRHSECDCWRSFEFEVRRLLTEKKAFFDDYSNVNSDPSELVATAYRLGITTADFQAHRSRQQEASLRF